MAGPARPRRARVPLANTSVTARRFCEVQSGLAQVATRCVRPAATMETRLASTPSSIRRWRTASARSRDRARFSSSVPGSSAWPSTAASNSRQRISHCACAASAMRARVPSSALPEEKKIRSPASPRSLAWIGALRRSSCSQTGRAPARTPAAIPRDACAERGRDGVGNGGSGARWGRAAIEVAEPLACETGGGRIGEAGDYGLERLLRPLAVAATELVHAVEIEFLRTLLGSVGAVAVGAVPVRVAAGILVGCGGVVAITLRISGGVLARRCRLQRQRADGRQRIECDDGEEQHAGKHRAPPPCRYRLRPKHHASSRCNLLK